jgi:alpha-beta hydrolase superfamily lysophospholipase
MTEHRVKPEAAGTESGANSSISSYLQKLKNSINFLRNDPKKFLTSCFLSCWRFLKSHKFFCILYMVLLVLLFGVTALPSFSTRIADSSRLKNVEAWPDEKNNVDQGDVRPGKKPDRLVVLLHGFNKGPDSIDGVRALVRRIYPAADIMIPQLPFDYDSRADLEVVAEQLIQRIDKMNQEHGYLHIILAGYSMGGILARKLWVLAHGAQFDGTVEPDRFDDWPGRIDRIVLLAGMNRGWSIGSAIRGNGRWLMFSAGAAAGHLLSAIGFEPAVFDVRRGAPFLTRMRLQWLEVERKVRESEAPGKLPIVIQLLGTEDDIVAPTDHIDLASGNFHYVEVKGTGHAQILAADNSHLASLDPETCMVTGAKDDGAVRVRRICLAMRGRLDEIEGVETNLGDVRALARETLHDTSVSEARPVVDEQPPSDVVLVIHGIRDEGYWARRLAQRIRNQRNPNSPYRRFETVTDSYGYFPILPFIVPWTRRSKVEWLLDRFVIIKSQFPDAKFHYIGHSNGTFLLAKALEVLPMRQFRFERVVTAGSVLRYDHKWSELSDSGHGVGCVANYVASGDWVVALFPNGLSFWGLSPSELGGAGHDGFGGDPNQRSISEDRPRVRNVRWVEGGHSAALEESRWIEIAGFVTGSGPDCLGGANLSFDQDVDRSPLVKFFGRWSPLIVAALLLITSALAWACLAPMCRKDRLLALGFVGWWGFILVVFFAF